MVRGFSLAVTVFFRRFPLLSALPSEDVAGGLALRAS